MADAPKISPLGDGAVTVDFGNEISVELNRRAASLAAQLQDNPFPGFIEAVPAYASVSIFYDLIQVRRCFPQFSTAFAAVSSFARAAAERSDEEPRDMSRVLEIPVDFSRDAALDMETIVEHSKLDREDVIDIFTSRKYRVYMLGFLPGFPYMGEVDQRIAIPRKSTPRLTVPKGSIGIAGRQTGVYTLRSPGGWQIIGRTDVEMFDPSADPPCFLTAGDEVRFIPLKT